jgi:hypothetical protein
LQNYFLCKNQEDLMKSFIRRTLALGAIGTSLLSVGLVANPAFALPQEQVAEKLTNVPVFVLGNDNGLILISSAEQAEQAEPSLYVFMTEEGANNFLAQANAANPEFAPEAQVSTVSLEALYTETQSNSEQPLRLLYVPEEAEASQAAEVNDQYRGGVPLFFARLEDGSLAPVQQSDGETIFPMFFSRADLETLLSELAERNPEARAAITVDVLPLEAMLNEMQTSDDATLNQIRLLPDSETINAIRSENPQPAQPQQ